MKKFLSIFIIIFICFLLLPKIIKAEGNSPTVDSAFISNASFGGVDDFTESGINLSAGTTISIFINGVVTDIDGVADISNVAVVFRRSSLANSCLADNNNCYKLAVCTISELDVDSKNYDCQIDLQYYADATDEFGRYPTEDWVAVVTVTDANNNNGLGSSLSFEINTLLAVMIPSEINYGELLPLQTTDSSNNFEMIITQQGNDEADVEVSGANLICSLIGEILVSNQRWALSDVGYAEATELTDTPVDTNFNLDYKNDDLIDLTKKLYFDISIPTGTKGICTGNMIITAIAH